MACRCGPNVVSRDAVLSGDVMYAQKALQALGRSSGSRCLGVACTDGVLLAKIELYEEEKAQGEATDVDESVDRKSGHSVERTRTLDPDSPLAFDKALHKVEDKVLVAISGWQSDASYLLRHMQESCQEYRNTFGNAMSARQVAEEVASFLHILSAEDGNSSFGRFCAHCRHSKIQHHRIQHAVPSKC